MQSATRTTTHRHLMGADITGACVAWSPAHAVRRVRASSLLIDALARSTASRAGWLAESAIADARLAADVAELLRAVAPSTMSRDAGD